MEITQTEQQIEKIKTKQHIRLWNNIKYTELHITEIPERETEE